jgi:hypothetical protein
MQAGSHGSLMRLVHLLCFKRLAIRRQNFVAERFGAEFHVPEPAIGQLLEIIGRQRHRGKKPTPGDRHPSRAQCPGDCQTVLNIGIEGRIREKYIFCAGMLERQGRPGDSSGGSQRMLRPSMRG